MKNVTTDIVPVTSSSYIEWGSVIAGSVVALASTAVLVPFGNAVGLSFTNPLSQAQLTGDKANALLFIVGIWIFATQLISSAIGGYIAGNAVNARFGASGYEGEFRDGVHGLLSWATSTVITVIGIAFATYIAALTPVHADAAPVNAVLAHHAGVVSGFTLAASSIVSAIAAWVLAAHAGDHRDSKADHSKHFSFRVVKKTKRK